MLKKVVRKNIAFLLVLFILLGNLPTVYYENGKINLGFLKNPFSISANATQVASGNGTWISGKLTYTWTADSDAENGATGSVSVSGSTLTVTATNSKKVNSNCGSDTEPAATTTTVTVSNASSSPLKIVSLTVGGNATCSGVSQGSIIAPEATFFINVTAPAVESSTKVSGTVTIAVEEQTSVTITAMSSPYISYTLNGYTVVQNGGDQSFTVNAGMSISLPAVTAPTGYEFKGWRIGSSLVTSSSFTANGSYVVYPVIVSASSSTDNFKVGSQIYAYWEDAVTAAVNGSTKTIIVNNDITLPDSTDENALAPTGGKYVTVDFNNNIIYTVPVGITLLIPFNEAGTLITNSTISKNYEEYQQNTDSVKFRQITLPNNTKMDVYGSVSVASKVYCMSTGQSGPYGLIQLDAGSNITFESGSNLYAFGYIKGSGGVEIKSGASVYESLFVADYPGSASNTDTLASTEKVFPFSKFTVRNVESEMTFFSGATEKVYFNLYGTKAGYHDVWIDFIGGANALFKTSEFVTKSYTSNRHIFNVHGNSTISGMKISISALFVTVDVDTADLAGIPIPFNYTINVLSGTTTLGENVILSKGSVATVADGAILNIPSGKNLYVLDGTDDKQNVGTQPDARIDVNGTINVSGGLFTSENGADIISSARSGVIAFNSGAAEAATVKVKSGNTTAATINVTSAQLHNGSNHPTSGDYAVGNYTATAGSSANTTFYYCSTCDAWYGAQHEHAVNTYTVTWKNEDGTVLETDENVPLGTIPTFDGETPSKEATAQYTYTFNGWSPAIGPVEGDQVYTATYNETVRKYRIVFWNEDGSEEFYNADYAYGVPPVCNGTPSKSPTAGYTYEFAGWASEVGGDVIDPLPTVEGDASYYAVFTATPIEYTVKWNINGEIQEETYTYNEVPEYKGSEPVKEADNTYRYTFAGWSKSSNGTVLDELDPVTKNVTYYAVFTKEKIEYTVVFVNYDGTELQSGTYSYNDQVYYVESEPQRGGDAQYSYTFTGWSDGSNFYSKDGDLPRVTANTTYTAQFERTLNKYTVTWIGADGNTLMTEEIEYGTVPVYTGEEPAKQSDWQYDYVFDGWDPEIVSVTGDAVYTAKFKAVLRGNIVYGVRPVLDGILSLKFYIKPAENAKTAKLTYTYPYGSEEITDVEEFDLTDSSLFDNSTECVVLRYTNIQSGCIARDVVLTIYDANGEEQEILSRLDPTFRDTSYSYCVADWSRSVITQYSGDESRIKTVELAKAIINYGYYSAEYFKLRFDGDYTNAESGFYGDLTESDISVLNAHAGIKDTNSADVGLLGCRVVLEGATTLRLYFSKPVESATVDGQACEVIPKDNMYYVELVNIASPNLDKTHTFKVSYNGSEYTFEYSVLSWANSMISSSSTKQETYDLAKALYLYWKAAHTYFAQ